MNSWPYERADNFFPLSAEKAADVEAGSDENDAAVETEDKGDENDAFEKEEKEEEEKKDEVDEEEKKDAEKEVEEEDGAEGEEEVVVRKTGRFTAIARFFTR